MIKKESGKWVLYSKDGSKKLGEFDSEEEAKKREKQVVSFKKMKETGTFRIVENLKKDGSEWDVILIESGISQNNKNYSSNLLENSVSHFDNLKAYAYEFKGNIGSLFDHLPDQVREANKDGFVKNLVGWYSDPKYGEFQKPDGSKGTGIVAKFNVTAQWLKEALKNAWEKGKKDLVGFSIDAMANVKETAEGVLDVLAFDKIDEVTVVTEPGAGGRLLRLVASQKHLTKQKETGTMKELLAWLREAYPDLVKSIKDDAEPEKVVEAVKQAFAKIKEANAKKQPDNTGLTLEQVEAKFNELIKAKATQETKVIESQNMLKSKVSESTLPEKVKDKILVQNKSKELSEAEINTILKDEQDVLASLKESGLYIPGQGKEAVTFNQDEHDKLQKRMDGMFTGEDVDGIPRFRSLHESYRKTVGFDGNPAQIAGRILQEMSVATPPQNFSDQQDYSEVGSEWKKKLRESQYHTTDVRRLKEATTLLTSTWTQVFGDSVRRRLMKVYMRTGLQDWRKIVSDVVSVPDFRTNRRQRVGGFGNLDSVSENGTYQTIALPTDEQVSYAVSKKGNLFSVSYESVIDDDLSAVKRLVDGIGQSAGQTLYEFVFDFLKDNGNTDYDSTSLFDSSNHLNYGTTALSDAALDDIIFLMFEQTEQDSSKPINGISPRYLIGPAELARTMHDLTVSEVSLSGGRNETVVNYYKQFGIEPIIVSYWTDANNWYLTANPKQYPTIEVGFLNGREEPEIFVQDQPTIGSVFTADKITYKIRHIYGGDVLDHRFMYGNVVS